MRCACSALRWLCAALVELREQVVCSPYTLARLRALTPKLLHCATASIKIRHHCAPTAYRVLPRACFTPGCASSCVLLVPLQGASKAGFVGRARRRSRRRALIQAILQKKQAEPPGGKAGDELAKASVLRSRGGLHAAANALRQHESIIRTALATKNCKKPASKHHRAMQRGMMPTNQLLRRD